MYKRNFFKIYVLLWFITGCKISYKTYEFEKAPEIKSQIIVRVKAGQSYQEKFQI